MFIKNLSHHQVVMPILMVFALLCVPEVTLAKCVIPLDKLTGVYKYTDIGGGNVNQQYGKLDKKGVYTVDGSSDGSLASTGIAPETLVQVNGKTLLTLTGWNSYENASYCLAPFQRSTATYHIGNFDWVIVSAGPDKPVVSISATAPNASETGALGEFKLALNAPVSKDIVVTYKITGTAKNRKDYTKLRNNVKIPAGNVSALITVDPVTDTAIEGTETVIITLNKGGKYIVGGSNTATVNISDN